MSELTIEVAQRENLGKNANRRTRAAGKIPAVVYGGGRDTVAIEVDRPTILSLLRSGSGENTIFLLKLLGGKQSRHAMIKDMQVDPCTDIIQHIDFQRVLMDQKIHVQVAVELIGEPVGVKTDGGILDFVTRDLEVECLPGDIPKSLQLDVSELHIGQHAEAGAITIPEGVELIDSEDRVVVSIAQPRVAEEETEEEEDLLEAAPDQPEVIGRDSEDEAGD